MIGQRWAIRAVAALVLANTGCASCADHCYQKATENAAECSLAPQCRTQVCVYMIHGFTPTNDNGLEALRMKLSENGFPKIGVGELASTPLIACDIKDELKCNPDTKFVLLGYDLGGAAAALLARELTKKGVPIEAVVLLDPLACGEPSGVRTLLITSGTTASTVPYSERLVVSDANHYKLPAHPQTVEAITQLLQDIAARNYHDPGDPIPTWSYKHAPPMHSAAGGPHSPEWNFLANTTETPPSIDPPTGTQWTPQQQPILAAPAASAGPVVSRK